jgi:peptide/nickel transport system substrate-binding protein
MGRRLRAGLVGSVTVLLTLGLTAAFGPVGAGASPTPGRPSTGHQAGSSNGTLKLLVIGGEWPNLDPALDTQDAADSTLLDSIYGDLFEFGAHGVPIPDEASGYKFLNGGMTVDISLRHGLVFSDGTPFTAQDVASSISRVLLPQNACICDADFAAVKSVTASGPDTVVLTMSRPFAPIIGAFNGTGPNWTVDPTALTKEGTTGFGQSPVGAGPYKVVHNAANSVLQLTANPSYWKKGYPKVKNLTFTSVANDTSAYDAILSGEAQVAAGVTTIPLIKQVMHGSSSIKVYTTPATFYEFVSLNETTAPFNNIKAREALYYATDPQVLVSHLYGGLYSVVESPTASGEDFYIPKVPGYRTYDLAKAKSLVKQLGGLSVTLATTANTPYWETEVTALQSQWQAAGIKVTLAMNDLEETLAQLEHNSWEALDSNWGGADPALALPTYFESNGPFTGIHDSTLDNLINEAAATTDNATRLHLYKEVAARMNQLAEVPFLYQKPIFTFATKNVHGISTVAFTYWENVSLS